MPRPRRRRGGRKKRRRARNRCGSSSGGQSTRFSGRRCKVAYHPRWCPLFSPVWEGTCFRRPLWNGRTSLCTRRCSSHISNIHSNPSSRQRLGTSPPSTGETRSRSRPTVYFSPRVAYPQPLARSRARTAHSAATLPAPLPDPVATASPGLGPRPTVAQISRH